MSSVSIKLVVLFLLSLAWNAQAQEGPLLDPAQQPLDLRPKAPANAGSKPKAPTQPAKAVPAPKAKEPPQKPKQEPQFARTETDIPTASVRLPNEKAPVGDVARTGLPVSEAKPPFDDAVIARYCGSLSTAASDGRLAWQAKRLEEMEARLRERISELENKRRETVDWLQRREEAMRKADESLVAIYAKMKPDAAAAQFSAMDESGAAAILIKLKPALASVILNEIDPSRAARIAAEMAGVGPRREAARGVP